MNCIPRSLFPFHREERETAEGLAPRLEPWHWSSSWSRGPSAAPEDNCGHLGPPLTVCKGLLDPCFGNSLPQPLSWLPPFRHSGPISDVASFDGHSGHSMAPIRTHHVAYFTSHTAVRAFHVCFVSFVRLSRLGQKLHEGRKKPVGFRSFLYPCS